VLLSELGYTPSKKDNPPRLGVYLSNALEEYHQDVHTLPLMLAQWLAKESLEATRIKRDVPVMVAMGNPPYSVSSSNKGAWIENLTKDYKTGLNERNINPLSDDYIKFMRMAEHYIEKTGQGVVAMITNHGYVDGVIHRKMRHHLMQTFDTIYILDLHGNSKKQEKQANGKADKNVFDIQQGVAIFIGVKTHATNKELATVYHFDCYGTREEKNSLLETNTLKTLDFQKLSPVSPDYFFYQRNINNLEEYNSFFAVQNLFVENSTGIKTHRDHLVIDFSEKELAAKMHTFVRADYTDDKVRQHFFGDAKAGKYAQGDTRDWQLSTARKTLAEKGYAEAIQPFAYRPFDNRYICYDESVIEFSRRDVMQHFLNGENLGLTICRQQKASDFQHIFVTKNIAESCIVSNKTGEIGYVLPLYLYPTQAPEFGEPQTRTPNLNPDMIKEFERRLGIPFVPDDGGAASV
jgi:predicted helicase